MSKRIPVSDDLHRDLQDLKREVERIWGRGVTWTEFLQAVYYVVEVTEDPTWEGLKPQPRTKTR